MVLFTLFLVSALSHAAFATAGHSGPARQLSRHLLMYIELL